MKDIITKIGEVSEYLNKIKGKGENKVHMLKVLEVDDESYYKSNYTLPICK